MKRVTGIGGIFFKCEDPEKQKEWYAKHLGIDSGEYGATFEWREKDDPNQIGYTAWSTFKADSKYFFPSTKPFMFNYRVENLKELLKALKDEGVTVVGEVEEFEFGKFGWIMDPEGNKIELWEPNDENYLK
ncbi:glyoxalase [Solitalea longa]|uniref:Glyoxalase n=1 Tax=Solitalea longa TaxID=2079460 RepID=A0A2S4ZYK8_9SPHI|nr:VOC family protein [Solitalea longa]POY35434.1 glyoxalase [Solitalea longa]